jgi:hypothetical protein
MALAVGATPATVFTPGRNLCKAVPLAALRSATGQHVKAGIFASGTCTWERPDLTGGVTLSVHPRQPGLVLMRQFVAQGASRVDVPGAREAVVLTVSPTSKDLFAAFPKGVVQVNMTAPAGPATRRLVAVMRLVAPSA